MLGLGVNESWFIQLKEMFLDELGMEKGRGVCLLNRNLPV
jgi:hypothetical protein